MPKRTKSTARGKRPDRCTAQPKPPTNPSITLEEALRRSKFTNAEKQAEAEAARDAADALKKAHREASWWTQGDLPPRSPPPSSARFEDVDEVEEELKAGPSTSSAERFLKIESEASVDSGKKNQQQDEARKNQEEKRAKREKKIRDVEDMKQKRKRDLPAFKPRYEQWVEDCAAFFSNPDADAEQFPMPAGIRSCQERVCVKGEKLGFCHHQLRVLLKGSDQYEIAWLKKERLRWHPDKFTGRGEVQELTQEMFQMMQRLIDGRRVKVVNE